MRGQAREQRRVHGLVSHRLYIGARKRFKLLVRDERRACGDQTSQPSYHMHTEEQGYVIKHSSAHNPRR